MDFKTIHLPTVIVILLAVVLLIAVYHFVAHVALKKGGQ